MAETLIHELLAKDIMCSDILLVYEGWTIHRLADFFIKHQISAAPVIASDHELVGVVSVGDVFRFYSMEDSFKTQVLRNYYLNNTGHDIADNDLRAWVKDAEKNCTVHEIMSHDIIAVKPTATLSEITSVLLDKHVHRVFVTHNKVISGVITAMDLLHHVKVA